MKEVKINNWHDSRLEALMDFLSNKFGIVIETVGDKSRVIELKNIYKLTLK